MVEDSNSIFSSFLDDGKYLANYNFNKTNYKNIDVELMHIVHEIHLSSAKK